MIRGTSGLWPGALILALLHAPPSIRKAEADPLGSGPVTALVLEPRLAPSRSLGDVSPIDNALRAGERFASAPRIFSSGDTIAVFSDDLESLSSPSQEGGWTHVDESFEPTGWNISTLYGCGSNAFWCGVVDSSWIGDPNRRGYANSWTQTLENFADLAGASSPYTLAFTHRMNIESGFDFGYVEVFDADDAWIPIATFTGVLNDGAPACAPYTVTIPDTVVAKQNPLRFRFRFESDIEGSSADGFYPGEGWAIDDVTVKGGVFDVRFFDDMEAGMGTWTRSTFPAVGDYWRIASNIPTQQVCTTNASKVWDVTSFITGALVPRLDDLLLSPKVSVNQANQVFLFFDVYRELPFDACFYYNLAFRTRNVGEPSWSAWIDPTDLLYFGVEHEWLRQAVPLTEAAGVDSLQFRIQVKDYGQIFCGGGVAASGTTVHFDNFEVGVIGAGGPSLSATEADLYNDTFRTTPFFGNDNFNTLQGDSVSVRIGAASGLKSAALHYSIDNATFASVPLGAVAGDPGAFYADVPAGAYPRGSELRYYFAATDSLDATVTLPGDALGASHYYRATVLPAIHSASAACVDDTARVLYVNGWAGPDAATGVDQSLVALGVRYDRFDINAAGFGAGNSPGGGPVGQPGSIWPAAPLGLLGTYRAIVWDTGERSAATLSAEDQTLLQSWLALLGANRGLILSGDNIASDLVVNGQGIPNFLACTMGATYLRDIWENAPQDSLLPTLKGSSGTRIALESFPIDGDCPTINRFDALTVSSCAAANGRAWLAYPNALAAATERLGALGTPGGDSSRAMLLGFTLASMTNQVRRNLLLYRTLVEEMENPGCYLATGVPGSAPPVSAASARLYPASPNPFNPRTTIRFSIGVAGPVRLRIYDVHGALVRTLADAPYTAGVHKLAWDGRNDRGSDVGSGAYFVSLEAGGGRASRKVILLR